MGLFIGEPERGKIRRKDMSPMGEKVSRSHASSRSSLTPSVDFKVCRRLFLRGHIRRLSVETQLDGRKFREDCNVDPSNSRGSRRQDSMATSRPPSRRHGGKHSYEVSLGFCSSDQCPDLDASQTYVDLLNYCGVHVRKRVGGLRGCPYSVVAARPAPQASRVRY